MARFPPAPTLTEALLKVTSTKTIFSTFGKTVFSLSATVDGWKLVNAQSAKYIRTASVGRCTCIEKTKTGFYPAITIRLLDCPKGQEIFQKSYSKSFKIHLPDFQLILWLIFYRFNSIEYFVFLAKQLKKQNNFIFPLTVKKFVVLLQCSNQLIHY